MRQCIFLVDFSCYIPGRSCVYQPTPEHLATTLKLQTNAYFEKIKRDIPTAFTLNGHIGLSEAQYIQFKEVGKDSKEKKEDKIMSSIVDECSRYISAFANFRGGVLFFGVDDNGT